MLLVKSYNSVCNVYLCFVLLGQSWGVCVRGVGHSHIDIVWLHLQKENSYINSICYKNFTMATLLSNILYTKGLQNEIKLNMC